MHLLFCVGFVSELFRNSARVRVSQVYVSDYNIFLKSDVTADAVQVTTNGKRNEILNGIPDWVYEGKCHREAVWHNRAAWTGSIGPLPIPTAVSCQRDINLVKNWDLFFYFQRRFLHQTEQYGGHQVRDTLLMLSLMTLKFRRWSSPGMDRNSILKRWPSRIQRWDTRILTCVANTVIHVFSVSNFTCGM